MNHEFNPIVPGKQPVCRYPTKKKKRKTWQVVLWCITVFVIVIGTILTSFRSCTVPTIVADITADAVTLTIADSVDLVERARPRYGLLESQKPFPGFPLEPAGTEELLRGSGAQSTTKPAAVVNPVLQRLLLDKGCVLTLETRPENRIDLVVSRSLTAPCEYGAAVLYSLGANSQRISKEFADSVPIARSLSFVLSASDTLRLRGLHVRRLAFRTSELGLDRSSVQKGTIRMPEYGDRKHRILQGDSVRLDSLSGELLELSVGSSIHAVYRGLAPNPIVDKNRLRPSASEEIRSNEWFTVLVGILSALIATFVPLAEKLWKPEDEEKEKG